MTVNVRGIILIGLVLSYCLIFFTKCSWSYNIWPHKISLLFRVVTPPLISAEFVFSSDMTHGINNTISAIGYLSGMLRCNLLTFFLLSQLFKFLPHIFNTVISTGNLSNCCSIGHLMKRTVLFTILFVDLLLSTGILNDLTFHLWSCVPILCRKEEAWIPTSSLTACSTSYPDCETRLNYRLAL